MKISLAVEVAVRLEEVFPWLDDPEKAMLWQKGVKKAEIIQETPDRIGTTFVEEMEEDGNALQMHGVITAYASNRMIAFHLESRIHEVDACYSGYRNDGGREDCLPARFAREPRGPVHRPRALHPALH